MNSSRLAALLLSGALATGTFAQAPTPATPAAPDAPPAPATQPAAPIERQAPTPPMPPGGSGSSGHIQPLRGPMTFRDPGSMGRGHGFMGRDHGPMGMQGASAMGMHQSMGPGFRIVPPGVWWRDPNVVQRLSLSADQTKKMDDIFQRSRLQLIDLKANIERQNAILDPMLSANPIDQAKTLLQIDKVAQARADLEKADAKMLLGIRGVLTPEQWTKLQNRGDRGGTGIGPNPGPGAGPNAGPGAGPRCAGRGPHPGGGPGGPSDLIAPQPEP